LADLAKFFDIGRRGGTPLAFCTPGRGKSALRKLFNFFQFLQAFMRVGNGEAEYVSQRLWSKCLPRAAGAGEFREEAAWS
jgi:hypothetical protein